MEKIKAQALDYEGRGIAKTSEGKVIFTEDLLPGEEAEIEIVSEKSKTSEGRIVERFSTSPDRIDPPCENYGKCGGCAIMHMSESLRVSFKENRVRESLQRIGRLENIEVAPLVVSPRTNNYRNHMQYVISGMNIGLRAKSSNDFACADGCLIEYEAFSRMRKALEVHFQDSPTNLFSSLILRGSERTGEYLVEFVCETDQSHEIAIRDARRYIESGMLFEKMEKVIGDGKLMGIVIQICSAKTSKRTRSGKRVVIAGCDYYHEILCGKKFRIRSGAFFQVNTEGAELLYGLVRDHVKDSKVIYDLFCGTGSIGLCCASEDAMLFGIEVSSEAVSSAKVNAELNGAKNASFVVKQAERFDFDKDDLPRPDVVIVDPPRKGMDIALINKLKRLAPSKIAYVSCDPSTLARDLKYLTTDYDIVKVTPVDMFPFSHHVESVALLQRMSNTRERTITLDVEMEDYHRIKNSTEVTADATE